MEEKYKRPVILWLATGALLVVIMVVVGGITRLTHSGLSMVDWKPLTGILPPISDADWQAEFDNYKNYPEFQKINFDFTLDDFKSIYWWEFVHRILGRLLGVAFIVPFVFFLYKRVFDKAMIKKLLVLLFLGGLQGFLGWFMVKSGLKDNPAVSHYRLAIHLVAAFGLFSYILWMIMDIAGFRKTGAPSQVKGGTWILLVFVVLQIVYGAFVAGLKAGLFYNTWPLMGGELISGIISQAWGAKGVTGLFEDQVTIQFIHRWLPLAVLGCLVWLWMKKGGEDIHKRPLVFLWAVFVLQFLLGVFTLLLQVPVWLGVLHQLGGLALLSGTVWLIYAIQPGERGH